MAQLIFAPDPTQKLAALAGLVTLADSFRRSLRARNRSPRTIASYLDGVDHLGARPCSL